MNPEPNAHEFYTCLLWLKSLLTAGIIDKQTADQTANGLVKHYQTSPLYLW